MISAVVDVNVLVSSALVALGNPRQVVEAWRAERFALKTSAAILADLAGKLHASRIVQIIELLRDHAELVAVDPRDIIDVTGDPEDDGVLAACRLGRVDHLVTGDQGLLALREHAGVTILTCRQFLEALERHGAE